MTEYLRFVLRPLRSGWTVLTGLASILGFLALPSSGFTIGRTARALMILFAFMLVSLTGSLLLGGWTLYRDRARLRVVAIQPTRDSQYRLHFVLDGPRLNAVGTVLDIRRRFGDGGEVSFALVEVFGITEAGQYQARARHVSPAQWQAISTNEVSSADLIVTGDLSRERIDDYRDAQPITRLR